MRRHPLLQTLRVRSWKTSTKVDQRLFSEAADTIEELVETLKAIRHDLASDKLSAEDKLPLIATRVTIALAKMGGDA